MNYRPKRDIPKAVLELKTTSPTAIREWIKNNRTLTVQHGNTERKEQALVTPQSISMWFKRHSVMAKKLELQVQQEEIPREAITEALFENGTFKKVPCIEKWIIELIGRGAKQATINGFVRIIKNVCQGILPKEHNIEGWGLKHPAQLTIYDGLKYVAELSKIECYSRNHKLALRNFLKSRGITDYDKISGKLEESAGKYAHLYAPIERINEILEWLKQMNIHAYRASFFAFRTACRISATLNAESKYFTHESHEITVFEKATRGGSKRRQVKFLNDDIYNEIKDLKGKLFDIDKEDLNGLLRAAYKTFIPELAEEIPMPFHFWRHQFAQHMLRTKIDGAKWNYAVVAKLGHWKVETLERYYGAMDWNYAKEKGKEAMKTIVISSF